MRKFIARNRKLPPEQNFARTRAEAIALSKLLSGGVWTDYNDHDPGVTIIEQFCYAMAELSYQADARVEDLLFRGRGQLDKDRLATEYFLLEPPDSKFKRTPVTDFPPVPDYLPIRKTFPANYELESKNADDEQKAVHRKRLRQYLTLFDALLVDFNVRMTTFADRLDGPPAENTESANSANTTSNAPAAAPSEENASAKKFASLLSKSMLNNDVKIAELQNLYGERALTIDDEIELKKYQLARYGEIYDEGYEELLKEIWSVEDFKATWTKVLSQLIKGYRTYAWDKRTDLFDSPAQNEKYGLVNKMCILLSPVEAIDDIELTVRSNEGHITGADLILVVGGGITLPETLSDDVDALLRREFPFYLIPEVTIRHMAPNEEG